MMYICCEGGNGHAYSLVFDSLMPWILFCPNPERHAVVDFNESNLSSFYCLPCMRCLSTLGVFAQQVEANTPGNVGSLVSLSCACTCPLPRTRLPWR